MSVGAAIVGTNCKHILITYLMMCALFHIPLVIAVCVCVPLAVFILLYYCEIYINQVIGKCTEVLSVKLIKQPLTFQFTVKFLLHGTSLIQHYYYI